MPERHTPPGLENEIAKPRVQTAEKKENPEDYIREERELLDKVAKISKEIPHEDLLALVGRVFEHSSEAGLSLVDSLRLTPKDVEEIINSSKFIFKHRELYISLLRKTEAFSNVGKINNVHGVMLDPDVFKRERYLYENEVGRTRRKIKELSTYGKLGSKTKLLISIVDHHFIKALSQRKITAKIENLPKAQSKGEKLAEESLVREQRELEGLYYGGVVRDFILKKGMELYPGYFKSIAERMFREYQKSDKNPDGYSNPAEALKDIEKANASEKIIIVDDFLNSSGVSGIPEILVQGDLVSGKLTDKFLKTAFSLSDEELNKLYKNARYQPGLAPAAAAKAELKKEITRSVQSRNPDRKVEIILDEKTGEYKLGQNVEQDKKEMSELSHAITKDIEELIKKGEWEGLRRALVNACEFGDKDLSLKAFNQLNAKIESEGNWVDLDVVTSYYTLAEAIIKYPILRQMELVSKIVNFFMIDPKTMAELAVAIGDKAQVDKSIQDLLNKGEFDKAASIALKLVESGDEEQARKILKSNFESFNAIKLNCAGELALAISDKDAASRVLESLKKMHNWPLFHRRDIAIKIAVELRETETAKKLIEGSGNEDLAVTLIKLGERDWVKRYLHILEDRGFLDTTADLEKGAKIALALDDKEAMKRISQKIYGRFEREKEWVKRGDAYHGSDFLIYAEAADVIGETDLKRKAMDTLLELNWEHLAFGIAIELGDMEAANKAMKKISEPKTQYYIAIFKFLESRNLELSPEEQSKLKLLNLVQSNGGNRAQRLFEIGEYFSEKYGRSKANWAGQTREFLSGSKHVAKGINQIIASNPETMIETMAAVPDLNIDQTSTKILHKLFPELVPKPAKKSFWGRFFGRGDGKRSSTEYSLSSEDETSLEGGDPLEKSREAIKMREFSDKFIATDTFGKYNREAKKWEKVYFSIPPDVGEPAITRTLTLTHVVTTDVSLPKTLGAKIIPERAFAIDKKGNRTQLAIEENSLGEATASVPPNTESVIYSFLESQVEPPLRDVSQNDLERNYRSLGTDAKKTLTEKLGPLPAELKLFVSSIKDKSPKEKLILIERFVRQICYYDFDNKEMQEMKKGKDLNENLVIMEGRMNELIKKKPKMAEVMKGKKYAGVCSDFAQLTTMLLREAGFASGVMLGFAPHDKSVKWHEYHALNFVLYPSGAREMRPVLLDATPAGLTEGEEMHLANVRLPSLEEREQKSGENLAQLQKQTDSRMEEILAIVKGKDKDAIQQLSNGELENIVNTLLDYEVKQEHFAKVMAALDAFWYTPYKDMDMKAAGKFLSEEIKKVGASEISKEVNAGHKFFELIEDYIRKFKKGGKAKTDEDALDLIQKIFDSIEKDLSPTESRAAAAVITYLKAKKKL